MQSDCAAIRCTRAFQSRQQTSRLEIELENRTKKFDDNFDTISCLRSAARRIESTAPLLLVVTSRSARKVLKILKLRAQSEIAESVAPNDER